MGVLDQTEWPVRVKELINIFSSINMLNCEGFPHYTCAWLERLLRIFADAVNDRWWLSVFIRILINIYIYSIDLYMKMCFVLKRVVE